MFTWGPQQPPTPTPPPPPPSPPGLLVSAGDATGTVGSPVVGPTITGAGPGPADWSLAADISGMTATPSTGTIAEGASVTPSLAFSNVGTFVLALTNLSGGSVTGDAGTVVISEPPPPPPPPPPSCWQATALNVGVGFTDTVDIQISRDASIAAGAATVEWTVEVGAHSGGYGIYLTGSAGSGFTTSGTLNLAPGVTSGVLNFTIEEGGGIFIPYTGTLTISSPSIGEVCVPSAPIEWEEATPPPPPPPPPTLLAELDYTAISHPTSPPATISTTFVGGAGTTLNTYPGAGELWYGPEPSCPAPYPSFLGCSLGANIIRSSIATRDGSTALPAVPGGVTYFLGLEIDFSFQIRPDTPPSLVANELVTFEFNCGFGQGFRIELEYNNRTTPIRNLFRLYYLDFGSPVLIGTFNTNHYFTTPALRRIRLQNADFAGQPRASDITLYEYDFDGSAWIVVGVAAGLGAPTGYPIGLISPPTAEPRFLAQRTTPSFGSAGSLINVRRVATVSWLPIT